MVDVVIGDSEFSKELAKELDSEFKGLEITVYPEGEIKPRIGVSSKDEIECKDVLLSLSRSRFSSDTNDYLVKILLAINAIKNLNPRELHTVIPYLHYARQPKAYLLGESVSLSAMHQLFQGVSSIVTINSHLFGKDDLGEFFPSIKVFDLDATQIFADYFKGKFDKPVVVGPDEGAENLVKTLAHDLGCGYECLVKIRDKQTGKIEIINEGLDVENKDVIIYDDSTATGNTLKVTCELIEKLNPKSIHIAVVHLWGETAVKTLVQLPNVKSIITSNSFVSEGTLHQKITELSISKLVANFVKKKDG